MATNRRVLRDALLGGDTPPPIRITTGIVTAVNRTAVPCVISVRLPEGTVVDGLTYPAWWFPREGDVTNLFYAGGVFLVHGPVAPAQVVVDPHRHAASDIDGTVLPPAPPPAAVPPAPPAQPSQRTVPVAPVDWGSWGGQASNTGVMIQGGPTNDAFWFYGGAIQAARAGGTIVAGSIYVERLATDHGVNGGANVRLGVHGHPGRPGAPGSISAVGVIGQLGKGQGRVMSLTAAHIAALNAGAVGLGLAHGGTSYVSADYLKATRGAPSGQLSLIVQT